jgi:hypothetical protein
MADRTLKERIEEADLRAERILADMNHDDVTHEGFHIDVRDYMLTKFLLEPDEVQSDDIFELAEISIEKLLAMNDKSVLLAVGSTTCTNQSSTDIKKVLLSLALQKGLGVKLSPDESAGCETIQQLADTLYARMHS